MSKRRWRHYEMSAGEKGLRSARHLHGDIYEVRSSGDRVVYRLLFAQQGRRRQVLLTLAALKKKTQKTPPQIIRLAQRRLRDWERRGSGLKKVHMGSFL